MNLKKIVPLLAMLLAGAVFIGRAKAEPPIAATLAESSEVLSAMEALPTRSIPPMLLSDAQGIAIIPRVIKAGFVVGGRIGHGVVFSKNADGSWSGPTFVHVGGASIGFQAGVQSTDMVLVFKTRKSLDRIVRGKGKLTLGADAAIAAGPVGREAQAGTDARLRAEIFSYSRSRGLFAGVSFEGAAVTYDDRANGEYQTSPPEVQAWAGKLAGQIIAASKPREVAPGMVAPIQPPPAVPVPIPPPPPPVVPMPLPAVPRP
jgi:lipid-binding SYLF domain-containing protein